MMVENKTSDQYLTTGKASTRSIMKLRRYRLLKTLTKNFNLKTNTDADTDAGVTAIALLYFVGKSTGKLKKTYGKSPTNKSYSDLGIL